MNTATKLSLPLRLLAATLRKWPRSLRKLNWWWERIYRSIGAGGFESDVSVDSNWPGGLQAPVRGRLHPFRVRLNLKDWLERRAYFSGQLYQRDVELAVVTILREGDWFIDIGANIGLVSLLAAGRIGKSGQLIAVEANPAVFARLKRHLEENELSGNSIALNVALGDKPSTAFMHVPESHSGTGTLTVENGSVQVSIEPADAMLCLPEADIPVFVKMDVEGYEARVLAGMPKLLARKNLALLIEISRDMLARIGDSSRAMHAALRSAGYTCYLIRHNVGRWGEVLLFERSAEVLDEYQYDALYLKEGSIFGERIRKNVANPS